MNPEQVETILRGNNVPFNMKNVPYGRQFTFEDGPILMAYDTGKMVWQGRSSETQERAIELLGADPDQITITQVTGDTAAAEAEPNEFEGSNRVFIVYGHDSNAREQLELLLRRLKLEPVVLQNLPGGGQTIIEKLEANSDVTFACVLLTPDDQGHRIDHPEELSQRARQNVVLEMGMFLAKLGRKRVAILHKGELELPSDINGLIYIAFDDRVDEVRDRIGAELQEAGFGINIKDLLS